MKLFWVMFKGSRNRDEASLVEIQCLLPHRYEGLRNTGMLCTHPLRWRLQKLLTEETQSSTCIDAQLHH
ncbi:unnamed protein product [Lota lota]